jgi:hypothetical protein
MLCGERRGNGIIVAATEPTGCPMPQPNDLSRSLAALDENGTLIAVIEMSQSSWLVAGIIPGVERRPATKLKPDEAGLLRLLHRWRGEAKKGGRNINRIAVAFEAGRDGFWLARWLRAHAVSTRFYPLTLASKVCMGGQSETANVAGARERQPDAPRTTVRRSILPAPG